MMEVSVAHQQTDTAMESELVSRTTTKIVNLDQGISTMYGYLQDWQWGTFI